MYMDSALPSVDTTNSMTLLDLFAAQAMAEYINIFHRTMPDVENVIARESYKIAQAMMHQREITIREISNKSTS